MNKFFSQFKNLFSSLTIPLLVVAVGSSAVFLISRIISSSSNYKSLVEEISSESFGNKWVAAYELSRHINSNAIPAEDVPWLMQKFEEAYRKSENDPRTRNFLVLAYAGLAQKNPNSRNFKFLLDGIVDPDPSVAFSAVSAVGNYPDLQTRISEDPALFEKLEQKTFASNEDPGLLQALLYTVSKTKAPRAEALLVSFLKNESSMIRYPAAISLIPYKNVSAQATLRELFELNETPDKNRKVIDEFKLSAIRSMIEVKWLVLKESIEKIERSSTNKVLSVRAREFLILLN